jgi:hypothetical protein
MGYSEGRFYSRTAGWIEPEESSVSTKSFPKKKLLGRKAG